MTDKIQELTDRLYAEGLSKGKAEGEKMLDEAKAQAESILAEARKEAAAIVAAAQKEADDLSSKAASDIKMASSQCLQATRKDIEEMLVGRIANSSEMLSSADFLKEIVTTVAAKFSASEATDLKLILPAALQQQLEPWVASELNKALEGKVSATFSKKIAGGFTIGPKDGSYYVSLTDESFNALIREYLRPVTRKLLFGE